MEQKILAAALAMTAMRAHAETAIDGLFLDELHDAAEEARLGLVDHDPLIVFTDVPYLINQGTLLDELATIADRHRETIFSPRVGLIRDVLLQTTPSRDVAWRIDNGLHEQARGLMHASVSGAVKIAALSIILSGLGFKTAYMEMASPGSMDVMIPLRDLGWRLPAPAGVALH
jgi:hypothetical protein